MRVLVADAAQGRERLSVSLAVHELTFARTLAEARAAVRAQTFDLLVVGARFDDSRMFDLLREVRADARHQDLRIVCVVASGTLEIACRAMDATAVLEEDFPTWVAALTSGGTP